MKVIDDMRNIRRVRAKETKTEEGFKNRVIRSIACTQEV